MSVPYAQKLTGTTGVTSSVTITAPTAGNALLVMVAVPTAAVPATPASAFSDDLVNSYLLDHTISGVNGFSYFFFRKTNFSNAPTTLSFAGAASFTGTFEVLQVNSAEVNYVEMLLANSLLSGGVAQASHVHNFSATARANCFVFLGSSTGSARNLTAASGFTVVPTESDGSAHHAAYLENATLGTNTTTLSLSGTAVMNGFGVVYTSALPDPTVSGVTAPSATEGSGATHTVTLSGSTSRTTSYAASLNGVTATSGVDFGGLSSATFSNGVSFSGGNLSVPSGVSSFTVTISTTADTLDEYTETYTLTVGGVVSGSSSIVDNSAPPGLLVTNATEDFGVCTFTVSLTAVSAKPVTVTLATANGSKTAAVDYAPKLIPLTFAPGELTKTLSVAAGAAPIKPMVSVSRTTGKEMLAVYFDASSTLSAVATNAEHECFYMWDFGDEVGETWARGVDATRSRNVAYGPQAAHLYKTAGVKTWTLTVIDGLGNIATVSGTVTVTAWTEAETIYISNGTLPVAGANGVGAGAAGYYNETTWAGVISHKAANRRIRLNNASTWAVATALTCENGMQVDGYGAGTQWNVTTGTWAYGAVFDVKDRSDVRIIGGKHTGTGFGHGTLEANTVGGGAGATTGCINILMANMESTACYGLWSSSTGAKPDGIFAVNCKSYDIAINGVAGGTGALPVYVEEVNRLALIGNFFDNVQSSHCTRIAGGNRVIIANNQFSRSTLSSTHCLTIRGYTNPVDVKVFDGRYTDKVVVCDNYIWSETASGYLLHVGPQNDGYAERHKNVIIERNYFKSAVTATMATQVVSGTCTIRNNLIELNKGNLGILVTSTSRVDNGSPIDTRVYNNTIYKRTTNDLPSGDGFSGIVVSTRTSGWDAGYSAPPAITGLEIKNNLIYAPNETKNWNQSNGGTGSEGVSVSGTAPVYASSPSNNSTNTQVRTVKPWAAVDPAFLAEYAPAVGSYALDGGVTVRGVVKDFFNATMTGTADIGAIRV